MDKRNNKFCPDCGHHLYTSDTLPTGWYYCADCNTNIPERDVATLTDVLPLRARYDSVAFRMEEEQE